MNFARICHLSVCPFCPFLTARLIADAVNGYKDPESPDELWRSVKYKVEQNNILQILTVDDLAHIVLLVFQTL